jgi:hypothetical protein
MVKIGESWYCADCAEDLKDELTEASEHGQVHRCVACGLAKTEDNMVERLNGWMCRECSHPHEVKLLGYCDRECSLCKKHPQWVKQWLPAPMIPAPGLIA